MSELTREKSAQIVALNAKGATVEAIANKAHVSTDTVRELLGNRNILMKEWKEMNAEEKRLYINQLIYDRHKSVGEVEELTGLAKSTIYGFLKEKTKKTLPPDMAGKIVELRQQGKTHKEIADELGIGTATVNRYLHKDKPSQINKDFDQAVDEMIAETKKEPAPAATDTSSSNENINSLYPNDTIDEPKSQALNGVDFIGLFEGMLHEGYGDKAKIVKVNADKEKASVVFECEGRAYGLNFGLAF